MRNPCLLAAIWLATCTMVIVDRVTGVEFDQRQPSSYGDDYSYYGEHGVMAAPESEEVSARTHLAKLHKLKKLKLKKRLLLQCLLGHGRRRRDTSEASGRFFLPVVLQSTNVNVGSGGGGGGGGYGGHQQQQSHQSGCMQMFGDENNHGPLGSPLGSLGSLGSPLGSLGSALGSLGPAPVTEETEEGGNRNYAVDWNRYARQFRRNFVRPLYRLF